MEEVITEGHHRGHNLGSLVLGMGLGYVLGNSGYNQYGGYRGYGSGYRNYGYHRYGGGFGRYGLGYRGGYGGGYPPVVYIQQQGSTRTTTKPQTNYWHYCSNPEGYYPHIRKCPGGWMQVVPQLSPPQ